LVEQRSRLARILPIFEQMRGIAPARLRGRLMLAFACVLACVVASAPMSGAASQGVNVSFTVTSATNIDPALCSTATAGRTDFGTIQPGSKYVTTADCRVVFGSSNDTAGLRVYQSDREGDAMWGGEEPGALDTAFASGAGQRSASFAAGVDESAYDMVVQPDHKIVVAGRSWFAGTMDYAITRFNGDGSTDTSFGVNGQRLVDISGEHQLGNSLVLLPDGSFIVGGMVESGSGTVHRIGLLKITASGSVDTTWGASGWRLSDLRAGSWEEVHDMVLQPDGKILAVGRLGNGASTDDSYVARFLADGTLDPSFAGGSGVRGIDIDGLKDDMQALELLPDGSIIATGFAMRSANNRDDMLVVKLTPAGNLDPTFGSGGKVLIDADDTGVWDKAFDLDIQPDGRIVVVGAMQGSGSLADGLEVVRLTASGALDTTFANGGRFVQDFTAADDDGLNLALLPNGSITVLGGALLGDTPVMQAWRLTSRGSLDQTFSGDGYNTYTIPGSSAVRVMGSSIHADGSVTFTGETKGADYDLLLGRIDGVGIADYAAGRWTSNSPLFGACLRASANVTPTWSVDGDATCTSADSDPWNAIPRTSASAGIEIARTAGTVTYGTVDLRFGVNTAASQRPGGLVAPLTFEVVAPA
jgi:uncharacterized delta-60 repeat protein